MARYLLDTNVLSALVRDPHGTVMQRIAREGEQSVCTSIIVAAKLRFGARKAGSSRLQHQVEAVLSAMEILAFDPPADHEYADLRRHLERTGAVIGPNDMPIAAHARAAQLILVTGNEREFRRVPDLQVENWLRSE